MTEQQEGERGGVSPPSESPKPETGGLTPPCSPGKPRRLRLVIGVVLLGILAGFGTWFFFIRDAEPKNDLERLAGDWQIAYAGRDTQNVVIVEGDHWQHQAGPMEGKAYRIVLNEVANPREIDLELIDARKMVGPPVKLHGVYAFENSKTVRLRINPGIQPRPKTLDDPDAMEWVLTRVKLQPASDSGR